MDQQQCPLAPSFAWYELVPRDYYQMFKNKPAYFNNLFDDRVLVTLQQLRAQFGPTTVNDWQWGGGNQYRGWRPFNCSIGAKNSQHKFGRAIDCSFKNFTADEVRRYILNNPHEFPHIRALEGKVSWLHFDVRTTGQDAIKVFNP